MFEGSMVALVTPFTDSGQIDKERIGRLIEFHVSKGTDVIVPCGCTGEAATLTHNEQKDIIRYVVETVAGRLKVIAGTGSNSTTEALGLTQCAKEVGADGALMITPYYNKPTPAGIYEHYRTIAEKVDIPIILYNVPSRTGISILPETVAGLSKIDNVVAIKEASGSMDQVSNILNLCDITVLSGDDSMTLPILAVGGKGVISVVANVVPDLMADLVHSFLKGDVEKATQLHRRLFPLCKALFYETNPIPVKRALSFMGMIENRLRLPLVPMSEQNETRLKKALQDFGLIS
jgi:4-hydroxy-tetrahydrodipicolinate synthase